MRQLFTLLFTLFCFHLSAQTPLPEYTILHFGNGFNDLDRYIRADVNQMEMVGSTRKIKVISQLTDYSTKTVNRYLVQKDSDLNQITSPILDELGLVDMGSWKVFSDFVLWGMKNHPAKRYFVIIGGHGKGWRESRYKGISPDSNSGNTITTEELGLAFERIRKESGKAVDIFGADACLMASIEVGFQLSGNVKYIVASEDNEPTEGWVYQEFLKRLNRESDMSPRQVSRVAAQSYMEGHRLLDPNYYSNQKFWLTISATDVAELSKFTYEFRELSKIIQKSSSKNDYLKALYDSRGFKDNSYADVGRFMINLLKLPLEEKTRSLTLALLKTYQEKVIIREHADARRDFSTGLHIWAPTDPFDTKFYMTKYSGLNFQKITNWGNLFPTEE